MQETSAILADGGVRDDWDFPTSLFGPDCWSCTIAPRSTDLTQADGYGLYSMVEEARFRFGQHMGDIARNDGKGTRTPNREPIMMVTVSMRYFHFAPLRYPDPVTIHMAMGAVGRSSTRTLARVSQGDTIICGVEGAQATMCEGRPHPMSEAQRENALRFLVHAELIRKASMSQHLPPLRRVDLQIRPGCGQAYTVEVRYGDLDTLGHVNNVAMVRVLEEGRSRMVADHRLFDGLDGLTPHVVGHQIDYMGETFYGADTTVSAGVAHVGPTRIRFLTTARQGERLVAASIIAIELHGHNGTAVPIPQIVRDRLTPLQLSPEMLAGR